MAPDLPFYLVIYLVMYFAFYSLFTFLHELKFPLCSVFHEVRQMHSNATTTMIGCLILFYFPDTWALEASHTPECRVADSKIYHHCSPELSSTMTGGKSL